MSALKSSMLDGNNLILGDSKCNIREEKIYTDNTIKIERIYFLNNTCIE